MSPVGHGSHSLLAGAVQVDITPPVGLPMEGYASRTEPSQGVHDPLFASVLALQGTSRRHVFVVLDVLWITNAVRQRLVQRLRTCTDLRDDEWSLIATHTHGGPRLAEDVGPWLDVLADRVAAAVTAALRDLRPVRVRSLVTRVPGVGVNRRLPAGPTDDDVTILVVENAGDGAPEALVCNVTCHPVVLGPSNRLYTADYPGYVRSTLQAVYGGHVAVLFTCGAAGDVNTGHTAEDSAIGEFIPYRTYERAQRIGRRLAGAIIEAVERAPAPDPWGRWRLAANGPAQPGQPPPAEQQACPVDIQSATELVELAFREFPDAAALEQRETSLAQALVGVDPCGPEGKRLRIERMYVRVLQSYRALRHAHPGPTWGVALQVVRVGSALFFMIPGELFVELGLLLKQGAQGIWRGECLPTVTVVGYANEYVGYLPTAEAFAQGGYEAVATPFGGDAGEKLVKAALSLARRVI